MHNAAHLMDILVLGYHCKKSVTNYRVALLIKGVFILVLSIEKLELLIVAGKLSFYSIRAYNFVLFTSYGWTRTLLFDDFKHKLE